MRLSQILSNQFIPAKLQHCKSRGYYVSYYVLHNNNFKYCDFRVNKYFKRYPKKRDALKHVNQIIFDLNVKLSQGWNPFEIEQIKEVNKLSDIIEIFIAEKSRELKANTLRSYKSFTKLFLIYCNNHKIQYMDQVTKKIAINYLDYTFNQNNVSPTTYNNSIKLGSAFFQYCQDHEYSELNPFHGIQKKITRPKKRALISPEARKSIIEYCNTNCPNYAMVCYFIYHSLIRPGEVRLLKIQDIDIENKTVTVPAEIAKNGKERTSILTDEMIRILQGMKLERYPNDYYLLASHLLPDNEPAGDKRYLKEWIKMRKELQLPGTYQLYSLRDTGMTDYLHNGMDPLTLQKLADHYSLDVTNRYTKHCDPYLLKRVSETSTTF